MDIRRYQAQRKNVKQYLSDHPGLTDSAAVSILTHMYQVPLVAMTHLVAEVRGWTEDLKIDAARFMKVYFNHEVFDGKDRISSLVEGKLVIDKEAPFDHAKDTLDKLKNLKSPQFTKQQEYAIEAYAIRQSQPQSQHKERNDPNGRF